MTRWIQGLEELAAYYDGFVVDQFGVLHDGRQPYPGAPQALHRLKQAGKRVIVLSNSGKRAAANARRLKRFGIGSAECDAIITSGELLWQMLHARDRAPFDQIGRRLWLGDPDADRLTLDGLGLEAVDDPREADALLLASLPDRPQAAESLWPSLAQGLARGRVLLCANPDVQRLSTRGVEPSTGALAERYAQAGGSVVWLGKPHPLVYTVCREALGRWGSRHFLAIGDSLAHDIGGGARAGYDTCFIAGGLHQAAYAQTAVEARPAWLDGLLGRPEAHAAPAPDWVLPTLRWSPGATPPAAVPGVGSRPPGA